MGRRVLRIVHDEFRSARTVGVAVEDIDPATNVLRIAHSHVDKLRVGAAVEGEEPIGGVHPHRGAMPAAAAAVYFRAVDDGTAVVDVNRVVGPTAVDVHVVHAAVELAGGSVQPVDGSWGQAVDLAVVHGNRVGGGVGTVVKVQPGRAGGAGVGIAIVRVDKGVDPLHAVDGIAHGDGVEAVAGDVHGRAGSGVFDLDGVFAGAGVDDDSGQRAGIEREGLAIQRNARPPRGGYIDYDSVVIARPELIAGDCQVVGAAEGRARDVSVRPAIIAQVDRAAGVPDRVEVHGLAVAVGHDKSALVTRQVLGLLRPQRLHEYRRDGPIEHSLQSVPVMGFASRLLFAVSDLATVVQIAQIPRLGGVIVHVRCGRVDESGKRRASRIVDGDSVRGRVGDAFGQLVREGYGQLVWEGAGGTAATANGAHVDGVVLVAARAIVPRIIGPNRNEDINRRLCDRGARRGP